MAYGEAMKRRVLALYDQGLRTRDVSRRLLVSESWCRRVKQRRHEPPRRVGGGRFRLGDAARGHLGRFVDQRPDATLEELRARVRDELGVRVSVGALWGTLRRMRLTLKKKSVTAAEQLRPDVAEARDRFFAEQLRGVPLCDVAVLDESYATTQFTRLRGRCPRDRRLVASVPQGRWQTLTMAAAITVGGVLAAATVHAATGGDVFKAFVEQALVPALRPGMVVVMDNLAAHKVEGVREAIEGAKCRLVYLPPYSPDFSPIENVWSKVKQLLRTAAARDAPGLTAAIDRALTQVTAEDCRNCFAACGYTLHLE